MQVKPVAAQQCSVSVSELIFVCACTLASCADYLFFLCFGYGVSKCICSLGRGVHSVHKFVHFGSEHCWSDVGGSEFSSNTERLC